MESDGYSSKIRWAGFLWIADGFRSPAGEISAINDGRHSIRSRIIVNSKKIQLMIPQASL